MSIDTVGIIWSDELDYKCPDETGPGSIFLSVLVPCRVLYSRSVQFSSVAQLCLTFCDPMDCSTPGFPVFYHLPEFTQTHVRQVGDAIQPSHPMSSPSPPAFDLSQHQGLFQWVSSSHQMDKYWSFSVSISPSNEYSGVNSFRIDWFDLLAVQGTRKNLLQHHSSKASILQYIVYNRDSMIKTWVYIVSNFQKNSKCVWSKLIS